MNYFKPKMDDNNKAFVIVLCFILLGIFVIVPIVLLFFSYKFTKDSSVGYDLSISYAIIAAYCFLLLVVAGVFLYGIYLENKKNSEKLKKEIAAKVKPDIKSEIQNDVHKFTEDQAKHILENKATEFCKEELKKIKEDLEKKLEIEDRHKRYRLVEKLTENTKPYLDPKNAVDGQTPAPQQNFDQLIKLIEKILEIQNPSPSGSAGTP